MIKEYLSQYKDDFNNVISDFKNIKTWYKQIPNLLTIARPIGMIPANILFFTGNVIPAMILTGILLSTDFFDGKLARKWNVQSKLGAFLDAVGDKIMYLGMAIPLMVVNPIIMVNILLEGSISFVNTVSALKGMDAKTIYLGKVKTWFLSLALLTGYIEYMFKLPGVIFKPLSTVTALLQGLTLTEYVKKYQIDNDEKEVQEVSYIEEEKNENNNEITERLEYLRKERENITGANIPEKPRNNVRKRSIDHKR